MVSLVVKINRILTFLIFFIVLAAIFLIVVFNVKFKNNVTAEKYLKSLGYEIEYINSKEVNIPENFGEGLKKYNNLQKQQGFNLEKYRGKSCIQKQYCVTSKKAYPKKYIANVLVYKNKLIGGDLHGVYYNEQNSPLKLKSIK